MPNVITDAMSGYSAGTGVVGSTLSGLEGAAKGLYSYLPSLSSLTGGPSTAAAGNLPATTIVPDDAGFIDPTTGIASPAPGTIANTIGPGTPPPVGAGGTAAPAAPGPNLLGAVAQALEMYQRYKMQQNLQNPNYVAGQIAKLQQPLSKNLVSGITKQVEAQAQERGLGGAPGLFQQALGEALAPYTFAEQNQAAQEYFDALGFANQEYPQVGGYGNFAQELAQGASALGF